MIVNPTVPIGAGRSQSDAAGGDAVDVPVGQSPAYLDCVLNLVDVRDVTAGMVLAAERGRTGERYILGGENVALARPFDVAGADIGPCDAEACAAWRRRFGVGGDGGMRSPIG